VLSLILPTFNEAENLPLLLPRIEHILKNIPHEIIIVDDDSPDGTWRKAQEIAKEIPSVYVIRRQGERGLSTAVVAGFHAARGSVLAVMDADGQHDSSLLVQLYDAILQHRGMAVASRYIPGGGVGAWAGRRRLLSRIATKLTVLLCRIPVSDPMSGFFAIDRSLFERVSADLSPRGFKILFDLLVRVPRGTAMTEILRTADAGEKQAIASGSVAVSPFTYRYFLCAICVASVGNFHSCDDRYHRGVCPPGMGDSITIFRL